ncbi:MAG: MTH938/NDUFAF3 family protein [Desulfobacterales bacterium]|nr:MTH938/NDUFAF3 family protein [Desulfobacterales bacterium]
MAKEAVKMIDRFQFGRMTIRGETYTTDVQIFPDGRVADGWWRKHGHRLTLADLEVLLASKPDVLVVGTGVYGRVLPEDGLEATLQKMGIDLILAPNDEAVAHFNRLFANRPTAGGFHLTC